MPGVIVTMRTPGDDQVAVLQEKRAALVFLLRVEGDGPRDRCFTRARDRCLNVHGAAELLGTRSQVEHMQCLGGDAIRDRCGDDVEIVADRIDHGSARDADFGDDVVAPRTDVRIAVDRPGAGRRQVALPVHRTRVGVERVDAVVLGRDVDDIVRAAGDRDLIHIQRLGKYVAVDGDGEQLAEGARADVARGESGLGGVLSRPGIVIVVRGHVHLGPNRRRQDGQQSGRDDRKPAERRAEGNL